MLVWTITSYYGLAAEQQAICMHAYACMHMHGDLKTRWRLQSINVSICMAILSPENKC